MSKTNQHEAAEVHHSVSIAHSIGALMLDASFKLTTPWTVLFGPSGSGKTTILRAIAGLIHPETGSIVRHQQSDALIMTDAHTFIPPHKRQVRYAPQRAALFSHLTVAQNVAYGAGKAAVADVIELFSLEPLENRMPAALSGGERQRVNLARAFAATDCRLMLLDEPFSGLDSTLCDRMLPRMQSWLLQHGIPVLSVTHDVAEAIQLKAEVVTLSEGKVTGQGEAALILASERERLLAQINS